MEAAQLGSPAQDTPPEPLARLPEGSQNLEADQSQAGHAGRGGWLGSGVGGSPRMAGRLWTLPQSPRDIGHVLSGRSRWGPGGRRCAPQVCCVYHRLGPGAAGRTTRGPGVLVHAMGCASQLLGALTQVSAGRRWQDLGAEQGPCVTAVRSMLTFSGLRGSSDLAPLPGLRPLPCPGRGPNKQCGRGSFRVCINPRGQTSSWPEGPRQRRDPGVAGTSRGTLLLSRCPEVICIFRSLMHFTLNPQHRLSPSVYLRRPLQKAPPRSLLPPTSNSQKSSRK